MTTNYGGDQAHNIAIVSAFLALNYLFFLEPKRADSGGVFLALKSIFMPLDETPLCNIRHIKGHMYAGDLPRLDLCDDRALSTLVLLEDRTPLPHPHKHNLNVISSAGSGRYSHKGDVVFFSATDNSDPCLNGRKYVVMDSALREVRALGKEGNYENRRRFNFLRHFFGAGFGCSEILTKEQGAINLSNACYGISPGSGILARSADIFLGSPEQPTVSVAAKGVTVGDSECAWDISVILDFSIDGECSANITMSNEDGVNAKIEVEGENATLVIDRLGHLYDRSGASGQCLIASFFKYFADNSENANIDPCCAKYASTISISRVGRNFPNLILIA